MKLVVEFTIVGLPKTINAIGRHHWSVKVKEATLWKKAVFHECLLQNVKGLNLEKATLELTRHSAKEPDFDNLAGSFKHVIDGLVEAGVIVDDKPSVIGAPKFLWVRSPQRSGKITVKVFTDQALPQDAPQPTS